MNTFFGNFMIKISTITDPGQQSKVITYTQTPYLPSVPSTTDDIKNWSLCFDGSKSKEGTCIGCVLIDPTGNKTFISCQLEFECNNKTTKYEALLQGLRKALDMDVRNLIAFGDS
jgi:hypothetical protein